MQKGILLVAATRFEVKELLIDAEEISNSLYKSKQFHILITGVGLMHAAFALATTLNQLKDEIKQVIHLGIAGDYNSEKDLSTVYQVTSASYGDLGTLTKNGFQSFYEDGLLNPNTFPFENGIIHNHSLVNNQVINDLPQAHCVNLNLLSTEKDLIADRKRNAESLCSEYHILEHMECLAVFYACSQNKIPFVSLLASSNRVGDSDKEQWEFKTAILNLNKIVSAYL
jgi:futalosine hydrolase